jgi:predicted nuclease with RNAse H fold
VTRSRRSLVVGIDVGAHRLHCASLSDAGVVTDARVFAADATGDLIEWIAAATAIAVDAPAQLSRGRHQHDLQLAPKFRVARCCEIALGLRHGIWVPWVAPIEAPGEGWMAVGFRVFASLRRAGLRAIEVFPYAGFRTLNAGRPLPKKTTAAGLEARLALLRAAGVETTIRSHHVADAVLAAVVARDYSRGTAEAVSCGHDDSVIWLPEACWRPPPAHLARARALQRSTSPRPQSRP